MKKLILFSILVVLSGPTLAYFDFDFDPAIVKVDQISCDTSDSGTETGRCIVYTINSDTRASFRKVAFLVELEVLQSSVDPVVKAQLDPTGDYKSLLGLYVSMQYACLMNINDGHLIRQLKSVNVEYSYLQLVEPNQNLQHCLLLSLEDDLDGVRK